MASSSELSTVCRRMSFQILHKRVITRSIAARPFSTSARIFKDKDIGPDKTHTLNKGKDTNVQSDASRQGQEHRAQGTGGAGTSQQDAQNTTAKAKKEFPEAPDTVIGMQDERGGKGH